jgi:curved DNA-binding protein CbpA
MSDGESTRPNEPPPSQQIDPYAILKVDRNASDEAIQKAYKLLSRAFHPDKHAPGPTRDEAQEIFVSFKNAYDILSDPVQRQAYDDLGHAGTTFVKRSLHGKDPDALYPTLARLHQAGQSKQARLVLREALQQADVEHRDRTARVSCTLEFPCTIESTGVTAFPEMQEAHMSFAVSSDPPTPDNNWTVTVGGNSNVENGKGGAAGQVSVGYMPVQGTNVNAEIDFNDPIKVRDGVTFEGICIIFVCSFSCLRCTSFQLAARAHCRVERLLLQQRGPFRIQII